MTWMGDLEAELRRQQGVDPEEPLPRLPESTRGELNEEDLLSVGEGAGSHRESQMSNRERRKAEEEREAAAKTAEDVEGAGLDAARLDPERLPGPLHLSKIDGDNRNRVFDLVDNQGSANGYLNLKQVTAAISKLYPNFKHAEITLMAFRTADSNGDEQIERHEFRALLEYVRFFNESWDKFEGIGRAPDRLRDELTLEQFVQGALDVLPYITREVAVEEFNDISFVVDRREGVRGVPFVEFCKWSAMRAVPGHDYTSPEPRARPGEGSTMKKFIKVGGYRKKRTKKGAKKRTKKRTKKRKSTKRQSTKRKSTKRKSRKRLKTRKRR